MVPPYRHTRERNSIELLPELQQIREGTIDGTIEHMESFDQSLNPNLTDALQT